jgi:hypothetical protein
MRIAIHQHLEGAGEQRVTGQNGGRLVEGAMAGGLAATKIVIIHRRQVVMNQRIGVQHLDRGRDSRGTGRRHGENMRHLHHQEAAQPLAAAEDGVAHRLDQPLLLPIRQGQQNIERVLDLLRPLLHGIAKARRMIAHDDLHGALIPFIG